MKKRKPVVSEPAPVQVYLSGDDRARLDRLTDALGASKADVLRHALRAFEQQQLDPAHHPLLQIAGIARDLGTDESYDPAAEHDRALAEGSSKSS